ncbi:probable serine/threonine protein kinase IRE isoform X3 [Punica granatum]|uniref:non-specific serine/threonine protein kinase n=1 Tax=Punica granatum TaxID=22663 RepID=A0A6P8DK96_PUNGR|nr:probable serine/threonine protein kinase IRE isoform X3 [Punica granatum]
MSTPDQKPHATRPPSSNARSRFLKTPPIPIHLPQSAVGSSGGHENDGSSEEKRDRGEGEPLPSPPPILPSSLGLNQIRTRSSAPISNLRFSSSSDTTPTASDMPSEARKSHGSRGVDARPKWAIPLPRAAPSEPGKKVHWSQSKSFQNPTSANPALEANHAAFAKEIQSPRFQAILRLTSGRKKKTPDIKSFSHELNSKGVRPFPVWKPRAYAHMEEIMVAIRAKFDRLKEEVDSDLGIFAGDLVGILEKSSETHPEWKESLEDLLVIASKCAKMTPNEFWIKCEAIVQNLDDRRQELPMGTLKQAHTRLLFILTRCTRLVQFQKESGFEDDHILGLHKLSDLGVYPEKVLEASQHDFSGPLSVQEGGDKQTNKSKVQEQGSHTANKDQQNKNSSSDADGFDVNTARSAASSTSSYRMSSWKKLPSAAEKNRKGSDVADTPLKDKSSRLQEKTDSRNDCDFLHANLDTPTRLPDNREASSGGRRASWGLACENLMICRICEVEIPTVHVEEHSRICTIADRCDLKGLNVNERLERVAETLEKILESWTPRSTPRSIGSPGRSVEVAKGGIQGMHEELEEYSPRKDNFSRRHSEDMLDSVMDSVNASIMQNLNDNFRELPCEAHSVVTTDPGRRTSSGGSLTPRSPLTAPWANQIEMLVHEGKTISELENSQQVNKLLEITRSVANVNTCDYGALEYMIARLEDLKYAIQDRKVDALVVETFGRRIEKLLQEKYVLLCGQIEDEKADSSNAMADDESSAEDDTVRSLRASPINNTGSRDRTSIEDFEIIKPISRGAFGRVFLARKRATGDLFAIKLKVFWLSVTSLYQSVILLWENLYLVMEYLNGGDLYSLLRNLGCLDEEMARIYIAEVVLALEYLHSLNVIHRDLKPDNLLIGQDGHIKLTDFGLSKVGLINSTDDFSAPQVSSGGFLKEDETKDQHSINREQRQKHSVVGTPDYLAPEILLGMGHGKTADWWSVGIILYELLVGIPPFNADHPQNIFDNIMNRDIPWPKVPEEMSYDVYDLIDRLLTENPVQRLGATGAAEVKQHSFFKNINWDTLAKQKAMFIPSAESHDTRYFMSRYIWNPEDEHVQGGSDFDEISDSCSASCSSGSYSNMQDEDGDEFGSLTDFNGPTLAVKYSFSNFSFKNLSQLASINYDMVVKSSARDTTDTSNSAVP